MRNDADLVAEPRSAPEPPPPPAPLVILAADDELVCVDDLCLPPEPAE